MFPIVVTQKQEDIVRQHLLSGKAITPAIAFMVYGISRLSSVIERLRGRGMEIVTVMKADEVGRQYGEYKLAAPVRLGSYVTVKRGHGYGLPKWVRRTKGSRVVGLFQDTAHVEFIRGTKVATVPMNLKELSCVSA